MNYLDNAYGVSQVEEGVSNLLRRGRSLETKQETTLDDLLTHLPWTKGADQEKRLFEYDSLSDVGEIRVYQRADFQSGSRVLKKVF